MASIFSKVILSGSTNGRPIAVASTATPGTLMHTAHATAIDEVWLYAVNTSGAPRTITIEFGGVTSGDLFTVSLDPDTGLALLVPGLPLTNSLVVGAFADAAGVNITGWVNRIA
ncbi:MAG: hypothetical protein AB7L09_03450 [Nitrospira sp.]